MTDLELHGDIIEGRVIEPSTSTIYWVPEGMDPEAPTAADLAGATKLEGIEPTGFSLGPVSVDEVQASRRLGDNYTADLTFKRIYAGGRGYGKSQAQREMAAQMQAYGWGIQDSRYFARVLGSWQETPREELQRRLNNWLRGTYPGEPINWKGIS